MILKRLARIWGWGFIGLLLIPLLHAAWVSFSPDAYWTPPVSHWSLRWYRAFFGDRRWTEAAWRSLEVASLAAVTSVAVAGPAALSIRQLPPHMARLALIACTVPILIPPAALGTGLLPVAYATGLWGTRTGIVLVHAVLGLPIALLIIRLAMTARLAELEAAARGLGASSLATISRVTLPVVRPALGAATIAVFLLSLNESLVTLFLATPENETLPAVIWPQLRFAASPVVAVASCTMAAAGIVSVTVLFRALRSSLPSK